MKARRSGLRVAVAMSGGVDSSVAAALAVEAGHEVVGLTLQLYDAGGASGRPGACCAGADILDARRVAERLGIAHYVLDRESRFRASVIDDFVDSYARGETPIPCVRCNQGVKFEDLLGIARDLGAEWLATGHYARRLEGTDGPELHRPLDATRDQSYFLFATTRAQLDFLRFPLGELPKSEVRALATSMELPVADKPDSQDICFVPGGGYAELVAKLRPHADQPGEIVDLSGRVLGEHGGVMRFTVGQRRGLNVGGAGEPLYVVRLEPERRRVVVGPKQALGVRAAELDEVNWLGGAVGDAGIEVEAQVRSTAPAVPARWLSDGRVEFAEPELGVAPGQACVMYQGTRVLGGGFIRRTVAADRVAAETLAA